MEWETPSNTNTNLNANTNFNVCISANVLKLLQSDTLDLLSCSLVTLPIAVRVCLCTIFA